MKSYNKKVQKAMNNLRWQLWSLQCDLEVEAVWDRMESPITAEQEAKETAEKIANNIDENNNPQQWA